GTILRTTSGGVTGVQDHPNAAARAFQAFALEQNYPNPFNPTTVISYTLPVNSHVTLMVYDVLGREVQTLVNERQDAGSHTVAFAAGALSSGVYFYRLQAGNYVAAKKFIVLR
ncbi:MAG TPA: T9SS type A sorting domain-containing protein, partial [Bacteroidota bacterium]|nr:T9SS type A sorting domain-containing protein [Bacteroidota bacterium]